MLNFVLFLAAFIYLLYRIGKIEEMVRGKEIKPKPTFSVPEFTQPQPVEKTLPPTPPLTPTDQADLEFKFGSRIFTAVGALAVILGLGFFLRYAFQTGLITETARVVMGAVFGIAMLIVGYFLSKKYKEYGQILIGTGLGILYLSTYAAFNFYSLITHPTALILMLLITAIGVIMSLIMNAMWISAFAGLGGFLTPLLLGTLSGNPHTLFSYLIVLNLGLLAISYHKAWRPLILGSFVATQLLYLSWFFQSYSNKIWSTALAYISVFFLIYLVISLVQHIKKVTPADGYDLTLITANPILFFLWSYSIINPLYHDWMGLYTFGLAILYGVLAYLLKTEEAGRKIFAQFLVGVALVFLVVAVPIQFDSFRITTVWALEGFVVTWIGLSMRSRVVRGFGLVAYALSFVRFITLDSFFSTISKAWTNERFITGLLLAAALGLGYTLYKRYHGALEASEMASSSFLSVLSYLTLILSLSLEIWDFQKLLWLPVVWSALALLAGVTSLYTKDVALRTLAYVSFGLAMVRILFTEHFVNLTTHTPIFNSRVGTSIFLIVALGVFLFWLSKTQEDEIVEEKKTMSAVGLFVLNIFTLWLLSVEVLDYFNKQIASANKSGRQELVTLNNIKRASLSVAWTIYAVVVLVVGIIAKSASARLFSILLFAVVVAKVFLYDTANLNNFWRFVSFITLGVILLVSGYLYHRFKDRITHFIKADETARG